MKCPPLIALDVTKLQVTGRYLSPGELGGCSPNNFESTVDALKFWQRFGLPNHPQKLFRNM